MQALALQFTKPFGVAILEEQIPRPTSHQVLVQTIVSAVSAGTELLVYRGQWPADLPIDDTIPALDGRFSFPLKYGYAAVGRVIAAGASIPEDWLGGLVFAFHPHQSHFLATPDQLIPLPAGMEPEQAVFLPNMETAVSFIMDGRPTIGERVVVFGQGIVGLLTTSLLAKMPLEHLVTVDRYPLRRDKSLSCGAGTVLDAADGKIRARVLAALCAQCREDGADLCYELSGNPSALDDAISVTGYSGRIVVGSWYGAKRADVDLGGRFHRGRIQLISSQVSRLDPSLSGLWTKTRRLNTALTMIQKMGLGGLVTHRFHISRAPEAYELLHSSPQDVTQVLFTYEES